MKVILVLVLCTMMCAAQEDLPTSQTLATISSPRVADVWLSIGRTPRYGFTGGIGGRYRFVGAELTADNGSETLPAYSTSGISETGYSISRYKKATVGLSVLGCYDFRDWLMFNGSVGYMYAQSTLLSRSSESGLYYAAGNDSKDSKITIGVAVTAYPIKWLSIGLGWNSFNGVITRIGYSWMM
jgi:hypothetical protein